MPTTSTFQLFIGGDRSYILPQGGRYAYILLAQDFNNNLGDTFINPVDCKISEVEGGATISRGGSSSNRYDVVYGLMWKIA